MARETLVAVIDTGVDASHPVFQDRVIYWNDATQEGRIALEKLKVTDGKVSYQSKMLKVPGRIAHNPAVYVGVFDETTMGVQVQDAIKTAGLQGLDFNRNQSTKDRFLVIIGLDSDKSRKEKTTQADKKKPEAESTEPKKEKPTKTDSLKDTPVKEDEEKPEETQPTDAAENTTEVKPTATDPKEQKAGQPKDKSIRKPDMIAFFDTDGNGQINDKEAETPILDFNTSRKMKRDGKTVSSADMVQFPSRTKTIAYPLLFQPDRKGNLNTITIAASFISHGTHVAGIVAGNGEQIIGAAPEAEIMSIKTCSGITCTEAAHYPWHS